MKSPRLSDTTTLVEKSLYEIDGGIHPSSYKNLSNQSAIKYLKLAETLLLPIFYAPPSEGSADFTTPQVGQTIHYGQAIISNDPQFQNFDSNPKSPVLSPANGVITEMGLIDLGAPSGKQPAVKITTQNTPLTAIFEPLIEWHQQPKKRLMRRIEQAGIVGLGGAMFPTAKKLHLAEASAVKQLLVNAMECEPYITCDDRLMQEEADDIILGAIIAAFTSHAEEIIFGIEDNKPQAIQALTESIEKCLGNSPIQYPIRILVVPTKYPSGGEKQLIKLCTGKEIPTGHYPNSKGVLVQNIGTLYAIKKAVLDGYPLTRRLVTITGQAIKNAGNYWIALGTPLSFIMKSLAISPQQAKQIIIGGPLMGHKMSASKTAHKQYLSVPILAASNCVIFNPDKPKQAQQVRECIRCSQCSQACPVNLLPQELYWYAKSEQLESLAPLNLMDCIECGVCDYVCPSQIPLVDYFRFAKTKIKQQKQIQQKSELAKQRFEQREARLDRLKQDREHKRRLAAIEREQATRDNQSDPDGKKAAIAAALQRVKSKQSLDRQTKEGLN